MRKFILKRLLSPILKKASAFYVRKRRKYTYKHVSVWVEPGVFPPFMTLSTKILLDFVDGLDLQGRRFLELGCGSGILSVWAAKKEALVTATDINPIALDALVNSSRENQVKIDVLFSDLFENLHGKTFDYILINPPYYAKDPQSVAEKAWFCGSGFEYFEKLFLQLPQFLSQTNQVYMILSEDCELEKIKAIALKNAVALELVQARTVAGEHNYIFRARLG